MNKQPRIGSLFSGYLGLDLGVRSVFPDAREAWVSDVDKGANKILTHRVPDVPNLGDVTRVDWASVEPVDILTGGSPCQDLSAAGRRAGMAEGTRSGLWASMREAIAALQPRLIVWENVRGALSASATSALEHCPRCMGGAGHGGRDLRALGRVLGDLADLGYDAQWHGLQVSDLGGCHRRWRVFVVAYADLAGLQGLAGTEGASPAERHGHPTASAGQPDLALLPTPRAQAREIPYARDDYHHNLEEWVGHYEAGTLHTLPTQGTRLARRERVKLTANNGNGMGMPLAIAAQLPPTPRANEGGGNGKAESDRHSPGLQNIRTHFPNQADWGQYAAAIARHERLIGRPAPNPTEPGAEGQPHLSPAFVEWMMCLPDGWVTDVPGVTRSEALKALGNGVVPLQCVAALRIMLGRTIK